MQDAGPYLTQILKRQRGGDRDESCVAHPSHAHPSTPAPSRARHRAFYWTAAAGQLRLAPEAECAAISHPLGPAGSMALTSISCVLCLPLHTSRPLCMWVSLPSSLGSQLWSLLLSQETFPNCLTAHVSCLEKAFIGLPRLPYPGPVPIPSACASPLTLVWCQDCLPPELLVTTVSPASLSSGLGTENMNEVSITASFAYLSWFT